MSKKNATRLADLKRAGFPFDPTRPQNWFAGILRSLLARNHPTDRVDLLAKQTLRQMNILTKGERREFVLRQVESAIQQLCNRNVLLLYTPTRVRLWDGLSQAKLEKYLHIRPVPWSDQGGTSPIPGDPDLPETEDTRTLDLFSALPKVLTTVEPVPPEDDLMLNLRLPQPEASSSPWEHEESQNIEKMLPRSHEDEREPTRRSIPRLLADEDDEVEQRREGNTSNSRLRDLLSALRDKDESMTVLDCRERSAVLDSSHGGRIDLEWRRGGELRVFVSFPDTELTKILRYVGSRWLDLVVAIDVRGRHGVQRIIPADTAPSAAASVVLKDVEVLEDAMGAGK